VFSAARVMAVFGLALIYLAYRRWLVADID
jgi:hypothetical protein